MDTHLTLTTTHGVSGEIAGTTSTQTLTNKTLTLPTIADLTNMNHAHSGASSGGQISHLNLTNIGNNAHSVLDAHLTYTTTHGVSGEITGTTSTQTLTNKTLTTPTIGDYTNANHTHIAAGSGGLLGANAITWANVNKTTSSIVDITTRALSNLSNVNTSGEIQGDIIYHSGTNWTRLIAGTSGRFLQTQGAGANPTWGQVISGERAKVSATDAVAGYLNGKLVQGTNITLTQGNTGGNETLTIAATVGGSQNLFETVAGDSGTSAVADTSTDTLTIAGGTGIKTAGDSVSDRITISLSISGEVAGDMLYRTATAWTRLPSGETNQFLQQGPSSVPRYVTVQQTANIGLMIDGGGSAITTGAKGSLELPWNCTINSVRLFADQTTSGEMVIDIWRDTYANYPPSGEDSICASAKPTISNSNKSQDTTLTGWTTSLYKGNILRFNVDSVATITRVSINLGVTKI